ncbi:MAG: nucleoside monophosphate kinase, partial [Clostridiales bacterium]|nr:nucleoside monophosphate kinase [Clostridiales bacterium]
HIISRMGGRRACVSCGATYHVVYNPPKKEDVCDRCGGKLVLRDDDRPETVKNRLDVYHAQTQSLIDYYKDKKVLVTVDGTQSMDDVFSAILEKLGE